jgi:predicted transcriptional regulator
MNWIDVTRPLQQNLAGWPGDTPVLLEQRWSRARGDSVTVLAAMNMMPEASPSTVQRRLKSLRAKGLLSFESAPHDARVRHVVPTSQATAYFDGMSDLMQRAVDRR